MLIGLSLDVVQCVALAVAASVAVRLLTRSFICQVLLRGLLPVEHQALWDTLVEACRIFSSRYVTLADVNRGHTALLRFCVGFEGLYGQEHCVPNLHFVLHLRDSVLDFGPPASFWLYSFERCNGLLGQTYTNNSTPEVTFLKRLTDRQQLISIEALSNIVLSSAEILMFQRLTGPSETSSDTDSHDGTETLKFLDLALARTHPTGAEPLPFLLPTRPSNCKFVYFSPAEHRFFTEKLREHVLLPELFEANRVLVDAQYEPIPSFITSGQTFGSSLCRSDRSSFVLARYGDLNRPGQVSYYFKTLLTYPASAKAGDVRDASLVSDEHTSAWVQFTARRAAQRLEAVKTVEVFWAKVKWFKAKGPSEVSESFVFADASAPDSPRLHDAPHAAAEPAPPVLRSQCWWAHKFAAESSDQFIPVARLLCPFVPAFDGPPHARYFHVCALPRHVNL